MSFSVSNTHPFACRLSLLVSLSMAGMLLLAGCDILISGEDDSPTYPTTVEPLSSGRLSSLRSAFETLNDHNVCTPLDEFGFTEWDLGACLDREKYMDLKPAVGKEEVIERAKAFLAKNAEFTGVADPSRLRVARVSGPEPRFENGRRNANIDFHNQRYEGLEVKKTLIQVMIDGSGVYMVGDHWYPDMYIPETTRLTRAEAQESLVGDTISYSDWTGPKQRVITDTSFTDPADVEKVVLPIETDHLLKLHVAWKVGIQFGNEDDIIGWYVFVDAMSGTRLETRQQVEF